METTMDNESIPLPDFFKGALSDTAHTILGAYMTVVGAVSCIGNFLIIYVFVRNRFFRQPPINFFIMSLACGNLLESSLGFPLCAASNFARRWLFGYISCNMYGFTCYTATLTNMCTFVMISIYRYIAVCRPERIAHLLTLQNIRRAICFVWLYSVTWAIMPLVGWGAYNLEPYKTSCSLDWTNKSLNSVSYIICVAIFVLFLPLLIMAVAYAAIIRQTRRNISIHITIGPEPKTLPINHALHGIQPVDDIENRISKIVSITIILYVLSWMPYAAFSLLSACGVDFQVSATVGPLMMSKTQCAYTPIVYVIGHKKFRLALLALFRCGNNSDDVNSNQPGQKNPIRNQILTTTRNRL